MTNDRQYAGGELIRVLGMVFGIAAVVGGSVGQGILRTPGLVAGAVPVPALILLLWVLGGVIAAINAVAYAELGSAIPRAGGPYVFVDRAFGAAWGAIAGWADWLVSLSAQSFMAVVVAEFVHLLGFVAIPVAILAPAMVGLCYLLNLSHTRTCGSTQAIGSAAKGIALIALVVTLFLFGGTNAQPAPTAMAAPPAATVLTIGAFAIAMRAIQNTYDGWNNCIYFSEELTAPETHVPRSLFGGIALVTMLYVLVNAALIYSLGPVGMAASTFPAADALAKAIGDWAGTLLTLFGIVSVGAILNLNVMFTPRIALAMSRNGVLPIQLSKVRPNGSPVIALTVGSIIAAVLAASGTYEDLIAFNVALGFLVNSAVCLAALWLRRTEPALPRPWRMPAHPFPVLVAVFINMALLAAMVVEDPVHSLGGIAAATLIGLASHAATIARRRRTAPA